MNGNIMDYLRYGIAFDNEINQIILTVKKDPMQRDF